MFNNTARGIMFKNKVAPENGVYKFLVTELYNVEGKDIEVNYLVAKPEDAISFCWTEKGFVLDVEDEIFEELRQKAAKLHCEIYVYPKFRS